TAVQLDRGSSRPAEEHGVPALPWRGIGPATSELWRELWTTLASRQSLEAVRTQGEECQLQVDHLRAAIAADVQFDERTEALAWCDALLVAVQTAADHAA